jgi:hypothetical protein
MRSSCGNPCCIRPRAADTFPASSASCARSNVGRAASTAEAPAAGVTLDSSASASAACRQETHPRSFHSNQSQPAITAAEAFQTTPKPLTVNHFCTCTAPTSPIVHKSLVHTPLPCQTLPAALPAACSHWGCLGRHPPGGLLAPEPGPACLYTQAVQQAYKQHSITTATSTAQHTG